MKLVRSLSNPMIYLLVGAAGSIIIAAAGCADTRGPRGVLPRGTEVIDQAVIQRVLLKAPIRPDQDFLPATLLISDEFSAHLLQFNTREQRHIHRAHDLTFIVHRGEGDIFIDDRRRVAHPGDVFHIPRGTPHYCVNTGQPPLVAVLIFTPPFDGQDTIPVPADAQSYPRE